MVPGNGSLSSALDNAQVTSTLVHRTINAHRSPSSGPLEPTAIPPQQDQDPDGEDDFLQLRDKAVETKSKRNPESSGEWELADMILRISHPAEQLMRQAQTIAALSIQRDHLIREAEAERARRESEKEGWDREAEALIVQQRQRYSDGARFEEAERRASNLESENKALVARLNDAQARLRSLETDLSHLRPTLITQERPFPSPLPSANSSRSKSTKNQAKAETKEKLRGKASPTFADARAEHLLLAAQRIGRSPTFSPLDRALHSSRKNLSQPRMSTPRTPRRSVGVHSVSPQQKQSASKGSGNNHETPIDKLLSAARMFKNPYSDGLGLRNGIGNNDTDTEIDIDQNTPSRRSRAGPSSPKRRRLDRDATPRSALDVLADQAAVFSADSLPVVGRLIPSEWSTPNPQLADDAFDTVPNTPVDKGKRKADDMQFMHDGSPSNPFITTPLPPEEPDPLPTTAFQFSQTVNPDFSHSPSSASFSQLPQRQPVASISSSAFISDSAALSPDQGSSGGPTAGKRQRSAYMKWTNEEDELLADAVARYGQKWDLVQQMLPGRGYHQVRQRWMRRNGAFDPKAEVAIGVSGIGPAVNAEDSPSAPVPRPLLGLAPLSSEAIMGSNFASRPGTTL